MRYLVYILACADGTLYTGITTDLDKRVATHNSGQGAKYTRGRRPVTPVYAESCESKSVALRREYAIRNMKKSEKLRLIESGGANLPSLMR